MRFKYLREPTPNDLMTTRDAYKYLEYGMRALGWMPQAISSKYRWLYKIWNAILVLADGYLPIGLLITYIKEFSTFTPGELFSSLQSGVNTPVAFIRGITCFLNVWRFLELKELFDEMDKRCVKEEERLEVHRTAKRCNLIYLGYQFIYMVFVTAQYFSAMLRGQVSWRIYNFFIDVEDRFIIGSTFEYILMSAAVNYNMMADLFPLIFGLTIRLHLKLILKRIESLRTDPEMSEEQSYLELRGCIEDHKQILKICNLARPFISATTFVQFLFVGVIFGFAIINVMYFADKWTFLPSVAYIFGVCFETFPFSFTCNLIEGDCENLSLAIFQSNWISTSRRYKTTLIYFMHNVQQSIKFTAGSIFPICLNTNIQVAKLAFSVVTFVKQLNIMEKLKAA